MTATLPTWADFAARSFEEDMSFRASRTPLDFAQALDAGYSSRDHLDYLSTRLSCAMGDLRRGTSRKLTVSMPPREGKSQMVSVYLPLWILSKHPDWKIGLISHSPTLAAGWGRQVRREVEEHGDKLGIHIAPDAGAVTDWETTDRGMVLSRSAPGQSITGKGFNVLIIDDIVKDYADAHSKLSRDSIWDWWKANAYSRLEPPSLVIVVGTRWHEDDFIGRLLSPDYEGDPAEWETISFPAIAEERDVLGREPGQPLYSPILEETEEEALERWADLKATIGSYAWASLYQQRPAPAQGAIFDTGDWRYWTTDPGKIRDDGSVVLLDPASLGHARWLDSWDMTFKGSDDSDYVVGQRWAKHQANRYLIHQWRGQWSFTRQLQAMRDSAATDNPALSPYGQFVHERHIEDAANGTAIIDTIKDEVAGIKPVRPRTSKEMRARAITPEIESGNVYLPHPGDPGNEWVADLLDELREFPHSTHDDQVDALTQALLGLRDNAIGGIGIPGSGTSTPARGLPTANNYLGSRRNTAQAPAPRFDVRRGAR